MKTIASWKKPAILSTIGICAVLSIEVQAEKRTFSPTTVSIIHVTGGGSFGLTHSATWGYVGFEDNWPDSGDMTYRVAIWYDNINSDWGSEKNAACAIDRVYFNWTAQEATRPFQGGSLYDLADSDDPWGSTRRLDFQDWGAMSYSDKYSWLSDTKGNQYLLSNYLKRAVLADNHP